ncbi:ATP-dependent endonuclease of the OLD family-like protein [Prosthecochloris aestuarii DSM 271]|uniref:ATP-dependent endonuclease of the OLD family-like protein n=1 Tax=Prosthecochloris aestuarii (strain DSM 271 / SK 413) TaxID=290512 RepID=B4S792_PROA2|nr:AAA family ATPase [Prosthecochloris aestuarii]ACF45929.1 ATP-dependent endonuclease of the OLD family-like protein [Prosthecochloris aestuarii DSM 271]
MAAKKKVEDAVPLAAPGAGTPRPRLHKFIVKNFRAISSQPVEIELDDIVVLVGPNNAGKSSILRAYEIVMQHGSKDGRLTIDDFPEGVVDPDNLPEVELHTIIYDKAPGDRWIHKTADSEWLIREQWVWDSPNKDPKRRGFDVEKDDWDDQVPWGAPNVANARRPLPHRIDAFASPDTQATEIAKLVTSKLKDKITTIKSDPEQEESDYDLVLAKIKALQTKVVEATEEEIEVIEKDISGYLEKIFPNHKVKFDAKPETDIEKTYTPFKSNADVLLGPEGGYFSEIAHQGSGARRTLLWATLKYLSEANDGEGARPHVLLLDEPEICLHPSAIREARSVLYELPSAGNWQVMITSHSPIFIDLSHDNTTVIRVSRDESAKVRSTTLFRPSRAKLSDDDKKNMKLLNICDPYVHEFFFGGKQVIVEGDTEYTAFSLLRSLHPEDYKDVQIIRARGKGVIPSVARVLLQFSKSFSILHDTDTELTATGKANPAWGMNNSIKDILGWENAGEAVHLVACKTCFETAMFGEEVKTEKPYSALSRVRTDGDARKNVKQLLDSLLDPTLDPPSGCVRWKEIGELA